MLEIEILTSPDCGPCEALKCVLAEALRESNIETGAVVLKEVDVLENPGVVIKYGILSTPALAINGKLCFMGVPSRAELVRRIAEVHS